MVAVVEATAAYWEDSLVSVQKNATTGGGAAIGLASVIPVQPRQGWKMFFQVFFNNERMEEDNRTWK